MHIRALIYANLLNGVPEWRIAEMYRMTVADVTDVFGFVNRKIKSYLFQRRMPPIFCDTMGEARRNRIKLLTLLPKLNLDKEPVYGKIVHELVTPSNIESAVHDLRR